MKRVTASIAGPVLFLLITGTQCRQKGYPADYRTTAPILVTDSEGNNEDPFLLRAKGGTIHLVWLSERSGNADIYMTTSEDGTKWSEPIAITKNDHTDTIPEANLKHYRDFGRELRKRFAKPIARTSGEGTIVELTLPAPANVDHVVLMEDITGGERIRSYAIDGLLAGNTWRTLAEGLSVGHKRIQRFPAVKVSTLRLRVTKAVAPPKIRQLAAYHAG